jgi:hypothetical protein
MLLRLVQDRQHHVPHSPLGLQLISVAETFAASEAWCWVTGCEALRLHSTKTRPRDLTAGEMQAEPPVEICRNTADSHHHVSKTYVNRRHYDITIMWCSFRFWSTDDQCFALKLAYLWRKVWLGLASASIQAVRCHRERCLAWILEGLQKALFQWPGMPLALRCFRMPWSNLQMYMESGPWWKRWAKSRLSMFRYVQYCSVTSDLLCLLNLFESAVKMFFIDSYFLKILK